ncbi:MAG: AraC family transcriptional regulator [Verrucomicrobiota bacterium]|nr:AraC family transcriptional regulator [Verrucomicrobiota bacterium]
MDLPLFRLLAARTEQIHNTDYFWNNRNRRNPDNMVIQMTLAGECFYRYGGVEYRVRPGQAFIFLNPEESEYGYPLDATGVYRQQYLSFTGANFLQFGMAMRMRFGPVVDVHPAGEVALRFREIIQRFDGADFRDRFDESEHIHQLLMALCRELTSARESDNPVEYCHNYILNHHRNGFNIKSLLAETTQSREHLSRLFKERYGEPPATLLRRMRLKCARELLAHSERPLDEIARASGLADSRTLCRLFRQHYQQTPDEFRQGLRRPNTAKE